MLFTVNNQSYIVPLNRDHVWWRGRSGHRYLFTIRLRKLWSRLCPNCRNVGLNGILYVLLISLFCVGILNWRD